MAIFRYKLLDPMGLPQSGAAALPFDELSAAVRYLERQGNVVLDIARLGRLATALTNARAALRRPVRRKELVETLANLAMLLASGVPVLAALDDLTEDARSPAIADALGFMRMDIENGRTLSEAMAGYPDIFPALVVDMCRIGEETGRLDRMLRKSAKHLEHMEQIRGATLRALIYPAFLATLVAGAAGFWFAVVVPQLVLLFKDMDIPLPLLTQILLRVSDAVQSYGAYALLAALAMGVVIGLSRAGSATCRYAFDAATLRVPLVRGVVAASLHARMSEYLGMLTAAGVGVARSLELVAETVGNGVYRRRLLAVKENVVNGFTLSDSMRRAQAAHPFAIRMIAVGETTGRLDEQMEYVARVYREKLSALVEVLGKSLEPILLVVLGGVICLLVVGLLLPMYDLLGKMQG